MAFLAELDVDRYGALDAPAGFLPVNAADHDWREPYPALSPDVVVRFSWEPGEEAEVPNVYWYPQLWDWVCDQDAYSLLTRLAPGDLNVIGRGTLAGKDLRLVQVVGLLDVVDMGKSVTRKYPSYDILDFPAIFSAASEAIRGRIFRVPQSANMTFMGSDVVAAIEAAGISGLRFTAVDWSEGAEPT